MSTDVFLEKARRNLTTANSLIASDPDAACNRAYYAMGEAARAALFSIGEEEAAHAKTHAGLKAQFSRHLIKAGLLPEALSTAISQASRLRMMTDYGGSFLSEADARKVWADAEVFLSSVLELVSRRQ